MRLLSYPDFLERLAERVARLRERFGWLSGSKGRGGGGRWVLGAGHRAGGA